MIGLGDPTGKRRYSMRDIKKLSHVVENANTIWYGAQSTDSGF